MSRSLSLLAVLLPRLVLADRSDWRVSVWPPPGRPLPANGQLVIEGDGELQEQVSRIAERSPRLVADEDEVPLELIAVYRGEKRLTQAVLQPVHFGCGPAIHVNVSAAVEDERSQVQVLAEVTRAEGGVPVRFRLTPSGQQVQIGHGMCSGGFELQEDVRYSVRLVAVDMAGNESAAPGDELLIQGPKQ